MKPPPSMTANINSSSDTTSESDDLPLRNDLKKGMAGKDMKGLEIMVKECKVRLYVVPLYCYFRTHISFLFPGEWCRSSRVETGDSITR